VVVLIGKQLASMVDGGNLLLGQLLGFSSTISFRQPAPNQPSRYLRKREPSDPKAQCHSRRRPGEFRAPHALRQETGQVKTSQERKNHRSQRIKIIPQLFQPGMRSFTEQSKSVAIDAKRQQARHQQVDIRQLDLKSHYLLAVQVNTAVTATGRYPWTMQVTANFTGDTITRTPTGYME